MLQIAVSGMIVPVFLQEGVEELARNNHFVSGIAL
jgi:hypothetical protein